MSIKSQLERIKSNVDNSLLEVQAKGVAVPDDANSDNLPGLIAQISGGAEVEEITNEAGGKSVYINSEVPKLPEGYTRLQYIQSTGSQYINTGVKGKSGLKMRMRTEWSTLSGDSNIFGALESGNRMFVQYSGGLLYAYGSYYTSSASIAAGVAYDIEAEFAAGKQTLTVNGASVYSGTSSSSYSFSANVYLLALNMAGSAGLFAKNKLYACQIYEGGTLVRDYMPCLNASGVAGLYDFVTGVFYGDAAGVGFISGTVVLDYTLPEGYEELEYIESSGSQYVDTGFKPNNNTRIVIDLQGATTASGAYGMHYGVKQFMAGKASKNSWNYYVYYGSQEVAYAARTANDFATRHTIDHNKRVITTGSVTRTLSAETFSSSYNMYLFGANNDGALGWAGTIRVFACQIWDNGTLVRDYVPCKNASGTVGLWDAVNNTFTGDAAGVGFIAGPIVGNPGVSKVVLEDQVLIDLTGDTVTPESLLSGFSAHNAMGQLIQGAVNSGIPCAQGSLTNQSLSQSVTVSGLSFQPKSVFLVLSMTPRDQYDVIASAYLAEGNSLVGATIARYDAYYGISIFSFAQSEYYIQTNSNGFVVRTPNGTYVSGTYRWFAVG